MKRLFIMALIVGMASPASAGFVDGNKLYKKCSVKNDSSAVFYMEDAFCAAYINGVIDAIDGKSRGSSGGFFFCMPNNVSSKQAQDVVKNWLTNNPAERHYNAASLVAAALSESFPCK